MLFAALYLAPSPETVTGSPTESFHIDFLSVSGQNCNIINVTAVEAFPPMAALAKAVIKANGMAAAVNVCHKHSSDVNMADNKASGGSLTSIGIAYLCT